MTTQSMSHASGLNGVVLEGGDGTKVVSKICRGFGSLVAALVKHSSGKQDSMILLPCHRFVVGDTSRGEEDIMIEGGGEKYTISEYKEMTQEDQVKYTQGNEKGISLIGSIRTGVQSVMKNLKI